MGLRREQITRRAELLIISFMEKLKPLSTLKIKFFKVLAKSEIYLLLKTKT